MHPVSPSLPQQSSLFSIEFIIFQYKAVFQTTHASFLHLVAVKSSFLITNSSSLIQNSSFLKGSFHHVTLQVVELPFQISQQACTALSNRRAPRACAAESTEIIESKRSAEKVSWKGQLKRSVGKVSWKTVESRTGQRRQSGRTRLRRQPLGLRRRLPRGHRRITGSWSWSRSRSWSRSLSRSWSWSRSRSWSRRQRRRRSRSRSWNRSRKPEVYARSWS